MHLNILSVIWSPTRTLTDAAENQRILPAAIVMTIYAALGIVGAVIMVLGGVFEQQFQQPGTDNLPPEMLNNMLLALEIGAVLSAALYPFVWWFGISLLMQLATRFFGGVGPFKSMLAVVGVASVPLVLAGLFGILNNATQLALGFGTSAAGLAGIIGTVLGLGFFAWHVILVVIGAAKARSVGYGQSSGSCAISCAGCATLIIVVSLVGGFILVATLGSFAPQ